MKKKLFLAILILGFNAGVFSQARLIINGTTEVTIVEHGGTSITPIYLVVNNPAATAIPVPTPVTGTKGFIIYICIRTSN